MILSLKIFYYVASFRVWGRGFIVSKMCHFAWSWLVQFQFEITNPEHNLPRSRSAVECKLLCNERS